MGLDISHMWFVLLSSPQGENYVCNILVMLLGFCLGFFNICTAACLCWRRPHQSRHIAFGREGGEISDSPLFPWDFCYYPRLTPADPICCPIELHLVVESSSVPKESCGFSGLKITHWSQEVLPLAQHPLPLRRVRAAGAPPAQAPKLPSLVAQWLCLLV